MYTGTPVTVDSLRLITDYLNYDERPTVVIEYINASKVARLPLVCSIQPSGCGIRCSFRAGHQSIYLDFAWL